MCHSNRLTRVACWLADYPEWLQFCWDFVKPPRNDEIALQHFFLACSSARIFFLFPLCCMQFFSSNKCLQEIFFQNHPPPPPPQELNGRPLTASKQCIRHSAFGVLPLPVSKWRALKIGLFHKSLAVQIQKIPRKLNGRKLKPSSNMSQEISWSDSSRAAGIFGTFV